MTDSEDALATSVAETVEAMEAHVTKPTLAPLPTAVPATPTATVEVEEDDDSVVVDEDEDEVQCLWAIVTGETIPDGTDLSAGESFTKSWTFKNTGYCDWNTDYQIAFKSGDQMSGPDAQDITTETDPDESITIEVDLVAPSSAGTYTGYWQLRTDDGVNFGEVWVTIDVE
jgi:next-to-BRCA1 protein 1